MTVVRAVIVVVVGRSDLRHTVWMPPVQARTSHTVWTNVGMIVPLMVTLCVGTDCSGIEAPLQALQQLGVPYEHVFSSEI